MHNRMNDAAHENKNPSSQQAHPQNPDKKIVGDYIDFEEIK